MTDQGIELVFAILSGMPSPQPWNKAASLPYAIAFENLSDEEVLPVVKAATVLGGAAGKWRPSSGEIIERIAARVAALPKAGDALAEIRRNVRYFRSGEPGENEYSHPAISEAVDELGGMAAIRRMPSDDTDKNFPAVWARVTASRMEGVKAALLLPPDERPAELFGKVPGAEILPAQARALAAYKGPEAATLGDKRGGYSPAMVKALEYAGVKGSAPKGIKNE